MKRIVGAVLGVLLALTVTAGLPPSPGAAAPARGTLTLSSSQVQRASTLTVRGWLPTKVRRPVFLRQRLSWGWSAVARGTVRRNGTYQLTWKVEVAPGAVRLQAVAPRRVIHHRVQRVLRSQIRRLTVLPGPSSVDGAFDPVTMGSNVSNRISLSGDGQWAAFDSLASDLVATDTNDYQDVFLYDRATHEMRMLTNGRGTSYAADISADGRYTLLDSYASTLVAGDTNGARDVFVYDRDTDQIERLTDGNGGSYAAGISGDGRYVVFYSFATNLVPDDTNGYRDTFLYDRALGTTTRLTAGNGAALTPSISDDGAWVSFYSGASNLTPADRNHSRDVFLYDVQAGTTTRVTNGNAASYAATKALSGDGRFLTFWSDASNLVLGDTNGRSDVFVYDRVLGTTTRVAGGNNHSLMPSISDDGLHVAFESYATTIAPEPDTNNQEDVFVYDVGTGLVSRLTDGNGPSSTASISGDGSAIGFTSAAANLAVGDTNNLADVFVWQRG